MQSLIKITSGVLNIRTRSVIKICSIILVMSSIGTLGSCNIRADVTKPAQRVATPSQTQVSQYQTTQPDAYDISNWQGELTDSQASRLSHEVKFMILKATTGSYADGTFAHNAHELDKYGIQYGVYSYSVYSNPSEARANADYLHQTAPYSNFYANDCEENDAGSTLDNSTQAWANEMHRISNRPVILYSDLSFMNDEFSPATLGDYDALWVADYGVEPNPSYHYDLWQYSSNHYSPALGQNVDASVFPDGNDKSLSFWTGGHIVHRPIAKPKPNRHRPKVKKPVRPKRRHRHKKKHYRRKRQPIISSQYYQSHNIKYLCVSVRKGVGAYRARDDKYIYHLGKYYDMLVYRIVPVKTYGGHWITQAVIRYHGKWLRMTTNKKYVKAVYYQ